MKQTDPRFVNVESLRLLENKRVVVSRYKPDLASTWNGFVRDSKNATFLQVREYMDYHNDRFVDHSLLFYQNEQLVALMPANENGGVLFSHGGLTYGGILSGYGMTTALMLNIFEELKEHCRRQGLKKIIYKAIPSIYPTVPSEEDLYALFRCRATLIARNVSSCIYIPEKCKFSRSRMINIRRAKKNGLTVQRSHDFKTFMQIESDNLLRNHGVKPVHSAQEIKLLADRFPENIKLFASYEGEKMLAGIVVYESKNVAHCQYGANSEEGRTLGAQDIVEDYIINEYYKGKKFFDYGISTENSGNFLNIGLISRKEGFGASAVMYDIYEITV